MWGRFRTFLEGDEKQFATGYQEEFDAMLWNTSNERLKAWVDENTDDSTKKTLAELDVLLQRDGDEG